MQAPDDTLALVNALTRLIAHFPHWGYTLTYTGISGWVVAIIFVAPFSDTSVLPTSVMRETHRAPDLPAALRFVLGRLWEMAQYEAANPEHGGARAAC